ncbi:SIMPL domain-containing protein [uncultured Porticoccus sp.]|uniref:SIMPL domain-containing protein n=1 Tax=uncultured Porticoccus sp. TaxID=1256050 RepID=UPI0030D8C623|tara:strand:+ start:15004 stop:15732 length:729 start_codon:yes stop_codon:yes gene_type:complete
MTKMMDGTRLSALILGVAMIAGLASLGYLLGNALIQFKEYERSVNVKGLSEREYPADVVIWPIVFAEASNDLEQLYNSIEDSTGKIRQFLLDSGLEASEVSVSLPAITDKSAREYDSGTRAEFRFTANQTVTIYSSRVDQVRSLMASLSELGKQGIVFTGGNYQSRPEFLFTRLNEVKPEMIEEATREARQVAEKFAEDSQSELGKIKRASQGQFSITPRDTNNPHIMKVRVVSTIEYYLSD